MSHLSSTEVTRSLEVFELKAGTKVRMEVLKDLLPDASTALFFGKLYQLDYVQLSSLLRRLFHTSVVQALLGEGDLHSSDLQDYIIDIVPDAELLSAGITPAQFSDPTSHEFLPELWDQLELEIATSIAELIEALDGALASVQGKYGTMLFSTLHKLNKQRQGVLGAYQAQIVHKSVPNNLVVFDVSGSVSKQTAEAIVGDIVSLAYKANASLAIVSDNTYLWDPGTFNVADVMQEAEFMGTHYETLASVFQKDWSTVITIADYDSAWVAADHLSRVCTGHIDQVLDISLVDRPTFLAECLGPLASKVTPLLVGNGQRPLGSRSYY